MPVALAILYFGVSQTSSPVVAVVLTVVSRLTRNTTDCHASSKLCSLLIEQPRDPNTL